MNAPAPALRITGLTKRFGGGAAAVTALADVSLELAAGELLVVLGATGAGKTTLLRVIAGLETPDAGRIELGGRDAAALAPADRDVALVFQNFSLYPHLSVRENLAFPLRAPGRTLPAAEIAARVDEAAAMLRITRLLDRPAKNLSGGEMQRVAIGRAIVRRPRLFLLDEPLTNLDAKLRESLRVELKRLFRQLGVPVVYVTHDQAEALSLADRIAVLAEGRVLQVGPPREVYLEPCSALVARQLGQPPINLIALERRGGQWRTPDGSTITAAAAPEGTRALLGLRPEQLQLTAASPGIAPNAASGAPLATVEWIEEAGPFRIVALRMWGASLRCTVAPTTRVTGGEQVAVTVDWARARIWPETDLRD
ncbi:MAG: ABC transporter ATP-binding protein [Planctomycetes bacterium]|nr:ABC transporter ATP-binding protein [Planctomycetota bacterium]